MILDAILERPDLDDLGEALINRPLDPALEHTLFEMGAYEARGRLRLARGGQKGGIADLRACASTVFGRGSQPNAWAWRSTLAIALAGSEPDEARALAERDLQKAQRAGRPRGLGIAQRTLGLVEGSIEHLEEAVRLLERSPARYEHARALVELGSALRRAKRRADAREPLRTGLDMAHRCGAVRLSERAHAELEATGARPRRAVLSGADALTSTERRIADMAAYGLSNPEIAQALFVTRKTIENHLARIYGKLGINSRTQIAEALSSGAALRVR